jgi:hypothetical protein
MGKFQKLPENMAVQKIDPSKESFIKALKTAINFNHIFTTVETHTVIKIEDLTNCQLSNSWATCIPYATGYI